MSLILPRQAVADLYPRDTWQRVLFEDFAERLTSDTEPFPCIYGVSGFKANHLRFAFLDDWQVEPLAAALESYLSIAPGLGANTSLVVFFASATENEPIDVHRSRFWSLLNALVEIDRVPWPTGIPRSLDHAEWEFCFAGQPMFVVCNTPAHRARRSRASAGFMMTFQPRYVFDGLLGSPDAARRATAVVRARLVPYDTTPVAPVLGLYGDPDNREYAQYFLEDNNDATPTCPFHALGERQILDESVPTMTHRQEQSA